MVTTLESTPWVVTITKKPVIWAFWEMATHGY